MEKLKGIGCVFEEKLLIYTNFWNLMSLHTGLITQSQDEHYDNDCGCSHYFENAIILVTRRTYGNDLECMGVRS